MHPAAYLDGLKELSDLGHGYAGPSAPIAPAAMKLPAFRRGWPLRRWTPLSWARLTMPIPCHAHRGIIACPIRLWASAFWLISPWLSKP